MLNCRFYFPLKVIIVWITFFQDHLIIFCFHTMPTRSMYKPLCLREKKNQKCIPSHSTIHNQKCPTSLLYCQYCCSLSTHFANTTVSCRLSTATQSSIWVTIVWWLVNPKTWMPLLLWQLYIINGLLSTPWLLSTHFCCDELFIYCRNSWQKWAQSLKLANNSLN